MPQITLTAAADVATWSNENYAAGLGDHLPVGTWSTAVYRSAIRFNDPAWASWTKITKAVLNVYVSDHQHVGVRSSTIQVRRQNTSGLWTISAGGQDCENGFASSNNTQSGDIAGTTTDMVTFSSGSTANAKKSITVTAQVQYYFNAKTSVLVFSFYGNSSSDYTELWSREKGSTYDATLVIDYEIASVPNAPTLVAPAASASIASQTPTFSWTHSDAQSNPQTAAEVALYQADGTTLINTYAVSGAANSVVGTDVLPRGVNYQYKVRTSDLTGWGPFSALRTFSIRALPVVTIDTVRHMEFASGAPRLRVNWTSSQAQVKYAVVCGAFNSGWITGTAQTYLLSAVPLTDGAWVQVDVYVEAADALVNMSSAGFTPRYGLTTHMKDLGSVPVNWETPSIVATTPTDTSLVIEYGSNDAPAPEPVQWHSSLSSAGKRRYLYWRAWLIPSATQGPTLDRIIIPANFTIALVDHWTLDANFSIDGSEYVYGSRSMSGSSTGAGSGCRSDLISVRAGRSYILTGLMKSEGNPGCHFALSDIYGNWVLAPDGNALKSEVLTETRDWFTPDDLDVYRYRTQVWVAPADMQVYVYLVVSGTAGSQAWFDAIKLEESTVATPWTPGAVGASIVDAGGVQVDGQRGAFFRYRGRDGGLRDTVEGGAKGLVFGGDTEITSPSRGILAANAVPLLARVRRTVLPPGTTTWVKSAGLAFMFVEVQAGGGAGGGCPATDANNVAGGGGGGGGGYASRLFDAADLPASVDITVGAGGSNPSGGSGTSGGASSFGAGTAIEIMCNPGTGGAVGIPQSTATPAPVSAGAGGTASGGDINVNGGYGRPNVTRSAAYFPYGHGGDAMLGNSGRSGISGAGGPGFGFGPGGGGAAVNKSSGAVAGGAGADGAVILTEYLSFWSE